MDKKIILTLVFVLLIAGAIVALDKNRQTTKTSQTQTAQRPESSEQDVKSTEHIFIVIGENQDYGDVIGNEKDMPFLNSLVRDYAFAQQYYGNTHPSIGNYFMLTTGKIITNDDGFSKEIDEDNIVRQLDAAGKTWKQYSENIPARGFYGRNKNGYVQHHNPLEYFSDVRRNDQERKNLVPFEQLKSDMDNNELPNYALIIPNNINNSHSCRILGCKKEEKLKTFDDWLLKNIEPLLKNEKFAKSGNLIITFDEASGSDSSHGGGRIAWVIVGSNIKQGYSSSNFYQHENTLRFVLDTFGISGNLGATAGAGGMGEFLQQGS